MVPPSAEFIRRAMQPLREMRIQRRNEQIAGRDLVATTLSTPDEILKSTALRDAVLGRASYFRDEEAMVQSITNNRLKDRDDLIAKAANPENGDFPALSDAWKLIICDVRLIEGDASLQDEYEAQLREEQLQTLTECAKEVVRKEDEKMARRNARWFIPVLERLSSEELAQMDLQDDNATKTIWKQVSPSPPAWIQQIIHAKQPWGFVFYKTSEIEQKYGHKWADAWETIREETRFIPYSGWEERSIAYACLESIHCRGNRSTLGNLWTEDWPAGPAAGDLAADNSVREHFKSYRESLSSTGILHNTFIVVDAEPIPETLDEVIRNPLPNFWVWAYDADWNPSLLTKDTTSDGEEYQGRVRVSIFSLDAWFYAARYEGVSLRDMWLKAQNHPQKLWICRSKPLEEWHHEPYI